MSWVLNTLLILAICTVSYGIELNGTISLADVPPLYQLDEWTQCQKPNDIYCMVDAVLTSNKSSPILEYLKESKNHLNRNMQCFNKLNYEYLSQPVVDEAKVIMLTNHFESSCKKQSKLLMGKDKANNLRDYSAHTQKHYNRTLVHRGVCLSRCGGKGPDTFHDAAERCINERLVQYQLEANVLEIRSCSSNKPVKPNASAKAFLIFYTSLLALVLIATALHVLGQRCERFQDNKFILALSLKKNWQLLVYVKPTKERLSELSCFEGIRFIGTIAVILTHITVVNVQSYLDNPEFIEHMFESFSTKAAFNTPLWMQVFFSISGFLTMYFTLIYVEKSTFTITKCGIAIISRYIRITPVAIFALWFTMTWYPRLGSGPLWMVLIQRESEECLDRWWYHVLYIHNYLPLGKFCMGHTWYLAADMQLHVVGVVLILVFMKWRSAVKPVILVVLIGSIISTGLITYVFKLTPIITAQSPEVVSRLFESSTVVPMLYLPLWMNLSGYFIGIGTAFIFYNNQINNIQLNEVKWFNILFHLSLIIAGAVTLLGVAFLSDRHPPQIFGILYSSADRFLVALFFNIFLLGCLSNCKSILKDALLWRGYHPLGRLSYSVFIVHFILMRFAVASSPHIGHVSAYSMISLLIVGIVASYVVAIPVYLVIETPASQLWKAILSSNTQVEEKDPPTKMHTTRQTVPA